MPDNVTFLQFFESARIAYIRSLFPDHDPSDPSELGLIFAECRINYRAPGFYEDVIHTHVAVSDVARSSFRVPFEMRRESDGVVLAEGYGVLVGYHYGEQSAHPLPDAMAAKLQQIAGADH